MAAADDLQVLANDARARGYEAVADSVEGVILVLTAGDPVHAAEVHEAWVDAVQKDGALLRLLGTGGPHVDECAFPTAIAMRVVRAVEAWFKVLSTAVSSRDVSQ